MDKNLKRHVFVVSSDSLSVNQLETMDQQLKNSTCLEIRTLEIK